MLWGCRCGNVGLKSAVTMLCREGGGLFVGMRCVNVLSRNVNGCAFFKDGICYAERIEKLAASLLS